jgi:Phosphotransferase System HPr (HPr) Family
VIKKEFILENKVGLHARPAAKLVETVNKFESNVVITKNNREANGKSILHVLALGAERGDKILVKVNGEDEENAMNEIENLVKSKFYEE